MKTRAELTFLPAMAGILALALSIGGCGGGESQLTKTTSKP
jgi:hypothetical protein